MLGLDWFPPASKQSEYLALSNFSFEVRSRGLLSDLALGHTLVLVWFRQKISVQHLF